MIRSYLNEIASVMSGFEDFAFIFLGFGFIFSVVFSVIYTIVDYKKHPDKYR